LAAFVKIASGMAVQRYGLGFSAMGLPLDVLRILRLRWAECYSNTGFVFDERQGCKDASCVPGMPTIAARLAPRPCPPRTCPAYLGSPW